MQSKLKSGLTAILLFFSIYSYSQTSKLKPGFDKNEYLELLRISALQVDTPWSYKTIAAPVHSTYLYRSPVMGIKNQWDLWMRDDSVAIISLRGTTAAPESWLENYYSAMVPASGSIKISNSFTFDYHLADHPEAAVHLGWLIGMACLSQDILNKIDSLENLGINDFIIMGHSQGGAIAYLLTSYLLNLQRNFRISSDLHFKTYCSAAPKPGNLYYAYDFENITQFGWAFHVVNAVDWVPEVPFSIQNTNDFVTKNPFTDMRLVLKKQKFPRGIILIHVFNRLSKPTEKVRRRYQRNIANQLYTQLKKILPEYEQPPFYNSINYQRAGVPIVLTPDENYYRLFPKSSTDIFVHHLMAPYIYLAEKLKD